MNLITPFQHFLYNRWPLANHNRETAQYVWWPCLLSSGQNRILRGRIRRQHWQQHSSLSPRFAICSASMYLTRRGPLDVLGSKSTGGGMREKI
jgi:hypothetical protein